MFTRNQYACPAGWRSGSHFYSDEDGQWHGLGSQLTRACHCCWRPQMCARLWLRRPGEGRQRARSRGQGALNTAIGAAVWRHWFPLQTLTPPQQSACQVHNMSQAVLRMVDKVTEEARSSIMFERGRHSHATVRRTRAWRCCCDGAFQFIIPCHAGPPPKLRACMLACTWGIYTAHLYDPKHGSGIGQ